ncbi:MAG TPA: MoxR family ATPase [Xanthobacteraceae bacterium]|nr:MoxR family ATPase [Xanthobacteraceae bacterium]
MTNKINEAESKETGMTEETNQEQGSQPPSAALPATQQLLAASRAELGRVIAGQSDVIGEVLVAVLTQGHALLEGVPGIAKTLIVKSVGRLLGLGFQRVQGTPDLMPADILGTTMFRPGTDSFTFHAGPVFTDLLLVDEINRMPPRTQAALLECMEERQVTSDGVQRPLPPWFTVFATENPIDFEGTYPLPEAQLDRFLFKMLIDHPSRDEELEIVRRHGHRSAMPRLEDFGLQAVADSAMLAAMREAVTHIRLSEPLIDYIVDVIRATREHSSLEVGASTRAANMLASAVRAFAVLQGRDFVIPDDIKVLALPVLRHRLTMSPSAEIEGLTTDRIMREVLDQTPVPR